MNSTCFPLRRLSFRRVAAFAAVLSVALTLHAQTEKWKTYRYPADGFRVLFPTEPKIEQNRKEAQSGSILLNSYCVQVSSTYLCVAVIDQGTEATGLSPDSLLSRAKLGVLAAPRTQKLAELEIELDGHKGIELETESDTGHVFTRIYLVDKTLYQTMVTVPPAGRYPGTARFLDSFQLIPRVRY